MARNDIETLKEDYPWIQTPLVVGAPMRLIALAEMAVEISKAGGIGFIGAGTDVSPLRAYLNQARHLLASTTLPTSPVLPVGIGFINWGASLTDSIPLIAEYKPAAVWFFAPSSLSSLRDWCVETRKASPLTKVWIQIGSVREALDVVRDEGICPDILVVQGTDAGGHGLARGAGLTSLLPEVVDAVSSFSSSTTNNDSSSHPSPVILATGGLSDPRGAAAALVLGAAGIVLGTRFLASHEANISAGYQRAVLGASDGGQNTVRTKVYDSLRNTQWAETHNARGVVNKSYVDALAGIDEEDNRKLYEAEMVKGDEGWGDDGRMTTYAGAGVGLVREVKGAGEIVREVREGVEVVLEKARARL